MGNFKNIESGLNGSRVACTMRVHVGIWSLISKKYRFWSFLLCYFDSNNFGVCSVCIWTPETIFLSKKRQNGLFTSKYVHEFWCLQNHMKNIFLETKHFDNHFVLLRRSHPRTAKWSFKTLKWYGLVGPTPHPTSKRTHVCFPFFFFIPFQTSWEPRRENQPFSTFSLLLHVGFLWSKWRFECAKLFPTSQAFY